MNTLREHMAAVVAGAAPYWAGEAEVVRTYFRLPRTLAQDLFWLKAQACKEARPLRDLPLPVQEEFSRTATLVHHPNGAEAGRRVEQEMQHCKLLIDLITEVSGVSLTLRELRPLPEDQKLQEMRAAYRAQGGIVERAAVDFTEGGGGAMFQVLSQLDGGGLERRIAAIFKLIAEDEKAHGPMEIYTIARCARNSEDWRRARTIVEAVSRQRVLMRNEMFGYPLSPTRVQEIMEGHIEPWPMSLSL